MEKDAIMSVNRSIANTNGLIDFAASPPIIPNPEYNIWMTISIACIMMVEVHIAQNASMTLVNGLRRSSF